MATFVTVPRNKSEEAGERFVWPPTREQLADDGRADGVPIVMPEDFWSAHEKRMRELTRSHGTNWYGCKTSRPDTVERIAVIGRRAAAPGDTIGPFKSCGAAGRAVGGYSGNIARASESGETAYGFYWTRVKK